MITAASTPAVSRHGLLAQTGRGGKRGSGTVAPACLPWLPPDACVAGSLRPGEPSRSSSLRLFRLADCLGSPALPTAIWECRGGGNMAPSRGQCTREPRLHLPPGPGARLVYLHPASQARLAPSPTPRPAGSGSTSLTQSLLHFRPLIH